MASLRLGFADRGHTPPDAGSFFAELHEPAMEPRFREEANNVWKRFQEVSGSGVQDTQRQLEVAGFLPAGSSSGVFDYRTQSAVRLFQEYVRSVEGLPDIGVPDGVVGRRTRKHLGRWTENKQRVGWTSEPADLAPWFRLLELYRHGALKRPGPLQQLVAERWKGSNQSDTLPAAEWDFSRDKVHLIGIRRGATADWKIKLNNDVFMLLAGGGVFAFFGSTDPNPGMTARPPFLVPGQHLYRFGWHKISEPHKSYRAFRPRSRGVLVIRDRDNRRSTANLKDERLLASAVDQHPNPTINIHWSGRHTKSWSAGCQVISGGGYINHRDELVDCWDHASAGYSGLERRTRGAYNVLLDLVTVLSPNPRVAGGDLLRYTLINERDLDLEPALGRTTVSHALRRGLEILERHDRPRFEKYRLHLNA